MKSKLREILESVYSLGFEHGITANGGLKRPVYKDIDQAIKEIENWAKEKYGKA